MSIKVRPVLACRRLGWAGECPLCKCTGHAVMYLTYREKKLFHENLFPRCSPLRNDRNNDGLRSLNLHMPMSLVHCPPHETINHVNNWRDTSNYTHPPASDPTQSNRSTGHEGYCNMVVHSKFSFNNPIRYTNFKDIHITPSRELVWHFPTFIAF
jgi:hypothetical protein